MQSITDLSIRTAVAIESFKLQARERIVEAQEGQRRRSSTRASWR